MGLGFFLLPVPVGGRLTVPFDIAIGWITDSAPGAVALYCLTIILAGAVVSVAAARKRPIEGTFLDGFRTAPVILAMRALGAVLALVFFFEIGPAMLLQPGIADLMWAALAFSVGVIIPIGAAFLVLLVRYGVLEFIGTLMRPVMRPAFRLPGRSALDSVTSWVGSYSVGLYLTRELLHDGYYSKREAYTIATCFSTVSIGFVAVVAQTLDLLHLFPLIFVIYFVCIYLLTAILARTWPTTSVPDAYLAEPQPEAERPSHRGILQEAWTRAVRQAEDAPGLWRTLGRGFGDGLVLAATILGSILAVGTAALLLARETPAFEWLGRPLVPVLSALGIPDAGTVGPAVLVGITEMYIPALLVTEAALPARFFVAVLSVSQLIFFSSMGPMVLDMFRRIPVRAWELVALFLIRTAILVPLLAGTNALLRWGGVL